MSVANGPWRVLSITTSSMKSSYGSLPSGRQSVLVHGARGCMGVCGIALVRWNAWMLSTLELVAMPRLAAAITECHSWSGRSRKGNSSAYGVRLHATHCAVSHQGPLKRYTMAMCHWIIWAMDRHMWLCLRLCLRLCVSPSICGRSPSYMHSSVTRYV